MNITETYRLSFRPWYPGYQRFFLECDEELRRSAYTPKTRAAKPREKLSETTHQKPLAPRVRPWVTDGVADGD